MAAAMVFLRTTGTTQGPTTGITSDEITEHPTGEIILQVNGTMAADERWIIEQAMNGSDDWAAVHRTDYPGSSTIDKWQGPHADNRVFGFPVSDSCRYRMRKVAPTSDVRTNATVTAFWTQAQTRLSL